MEPTAGTETVDEAGGKVLDVKAVEPQFSGKPEDFARDIALLQAQAAQPQSMTIEKPAEVAMEKTEPEQPTGQPPAPATPEIPAKFLDKDGNPDLEKVEKSTRSAEEAIAKYLEKEKVLRQKAAEVDRLAKGQGYVPPVVEQAPVESPKADNFEDQIEADIKTHGTGKTLARLFQAAKDAAYQQARQDVEGLAQEAELNKRERELHGLAKNDPWVVSEQGIEALAKYRETNPRLANWTEAYKAYLGDQEYSKRVNRQVTTPTPKAVTAPPTPVTAGGRPSQAVSGLNFGSQEAIAAHLSKLTPDQEDAFWKAQGLPPVHKRR